MTTAISPVASYKTADGTELPLFELTLHPSDDAARELLRTLEEFYDAADAFRKSALSSKTPEERKNATLFAAEMRAERDRAFRVFLLAYAGQVVADKVIAQCGDQDMELIIKVCRQGHIDDLTSLYSKFQRIFVPLEVEGKIDLWLTESTKENTDNLKSLYEKLSKRFAPSPANVTEPKPTT